MFGFVTYPNYRLAYGSIQFYLGHNLTNAIRTLNYARFEVFIAVLKVLSIIVRCYSMPSSSGQKTA
jgi:hypothetical protein